MVDQVRDRSQLLADTVDVVHRVNAQMRSRYLALVSEHGLTPPQALALRHLARPTRMGDLAEWLCVDASYVTGLVDRLEALGFAERRADPDDRRARRLVITPEGAGVLSSIEGRLREGMEGLERLDDAELAELTRILRKALGES